MFKVYVTNIKEQLSSSLKGYFKVRLLRDTYIIPIYCFLISFAIYYKICKQLVFFI